MTVPITDDETRMQQLLLDLKSFNTLTWNSFTIFHDKISSIDRIISNLKLHGTYSVFDISENLGSISNLLESVPLEKLGRKVVFIVSKSRVPSIVSAVSKTYQMFSETLTSLLATHEILTSKLLFFCC